MMTITIIIITILTFPYTYYHHHRYHHHHHHHHPDAITWNTTNEKIVKSQIKSKMIKSLITGNQVDSLKMLIDMGLINLKHSFEDNTKPISIAAANGNLTLMKEMYSYYNENENLRNQRYTYASFSGNELFDGSTSKAAARYNHLEVITWLLSKTRFDYDCISEAVTHGHLDIIKLFKDHHYQELQQVHERNNLITLASKHSHLKIIKLLRKHPVCYWNEEAFDKAVENNHYSLARWLIQNNAPISNEAILSNHASYAMNYTEDS